MKDVIERFWNFVDITSSCWNWLGAINDANYGRFSVEGKSIVPQRFIYELLVDKIPKGLVMDHLCRNTLCVNPAHLQPVTYQENSRRGLCGNHNKIKTHCPRGHEYTKENTSIHKGSRKCKTCQKMFNRNYQLNHPL